MKLITAKTEAGEMVLWVKAPAAKPDDVSSITRTHMTEGEKQLLQVVLHMHATACSPPHKHTYTNKYSL